MKSVYLLAAYLWNLTGTLPSYHLPNPTEGSRNGTMGRAITRVQFWHVLYYVSVQFIVDSQLTPRVLLQELWFLPTADKTQHVQIPVL